MVELIRYFSKLHQLQHFKFLVYFSVLDCKDGQEQRLEVEGGRQAVEVIGRDQRDVESESSAAEVETEAGRFIFRRLQLR